QSATYNPLRHVAKGVFVSGTDAIGFCKGLLVNIYDGIPQMEFSFERSDLAVLDTCDVLVVGGSFGGMAAALALARGGKRVILIEPRTYLGREITATLRPWLRIADPAAAPDLIRTACEAAGKPQQTGEYAFNLDALKIHLEDVLLQA